MSCMNTFDCRILRKILHPRQDAALEDLLALRDFVLILLGIAKKVALCDPSLLCKGESTLFSSKLLQIADAKPTSFDSAPALLFVAALSNRSAAQRHF